MREHPQGLPPRYAPPSVEMAPPPDFVLVGFPTGGGKVAILASTELNEAELRMERDRLPAMDIPDFGMPRWSSARYSLTADMRTFTVCVADTYAEAFRALFEQWVPKRNRRGELPRRRTAIEGSVDGGSGTYG